MIKSNSLQISAVTFDIVICGGGGAGLWLLNVLKSAGYSVLLVEPNAVGGTQTIASQGMIHGGQRYMLGKHSSTHPESVSSLPARWDSCLCGQGEIDLRTVNILSNTQVMWPTGNGLSYFAVNTASYLIRAKTRKLLGQEVPKALSGFNVPIYELPEKVLDIASLVEVLSAPHKASIHIGSVDSLSRDGSLIISGTKVNAQIIICVAGLGNEKFLSQLQANEKSSQRRPLRQLIVKTMPDPLYGHGITTSYKPRVTVTSHPIPSGGYVWYLGGAIADDTLSLSNDAAISYAQQEMNQIFPDYDWSDKQWSSWYGYRAEAYNKNGQLPNGPVLQEYDNAVVAWPTKLTLFPLLGDNVLSLLNDRGIQPKHTLPDFLNQSFTTESPQCMLPWNNAEWFYQPHKL
jgi:hypothetical protein